MHVSLTNILLIFVGPLKRVYKLYEEDESVPIPLRTASRMRHSQRRLYEDSGSSTNLLGSVQAEAIPQARNEQCSLLLQKQPENYEPLSQEGAQEHSDFDCETREIDENFDHEETPLPSLYAETDSTGSSNSSGDETTSCDSFSDASEQSDNEPSEDKLEGHKESDVPALCAMAYRLRHKLSATACKDMLNNLLPILCADPKGSHSHLTYAQMMSVVGETKSKTVHYCEVCNSIFPDDEDIFTCATNGCNSFRYKGTLEAASQTKKGRQPRHFFILADVKKQLACMLETKGVWESVQNTKSRIIQTPEQDLTDIVDGKYYRNLCQPGQFLHSVNNISGIFNTDGIPLYSSSKVKLWPVFLAVNEFPVAIRFSREKMILAGIWQGKSKPPFNNYMCAFGEEMCKLYDNGFTINPPCSSTPLTVRMAVLLGTVDLQAKGYILNMTMHNGHFGCSTCEEPGETVRQGRGYARHYPYRTPDEMARLRDSDNIKYVEGVRATPTNRIKGSCGMSGLAIMPWFDVVLGIVPDYMHGVLLGVTKSLLYKFFSPTNSGKPYFIGKYLQHISKRMSQICPPDYIERMPRDLEKNYSHFKATELQSWLLFYALPCLEGYLPDEYMEHLALLCEGIHLLLGDRITEEELQHAESVLESFYKAFAELYGDGSCGLNVHNIGAHLVFYVRLWGPLWAWSCFTFEDWNAALLQSVHGTGDVTKQCVRLKEIQLKLNSIDSNSSSDAGHTYLKSTQSRGKSWSTSNTQQTVLAVGSLHAIQLPLEQRTMILQKTASTNELDLKKALRVKAGSQKLYSVEYSRMKKRVCYVHVVKCQNGTILKLLYFLQNTVTFKLFACAKKINVHPESFVLTNGPKHIIRVEQSEEFVVIPVEEITEKLFFMAIHEKLYIAYLPNMVGHSVFK